MLISATFYICSVTPEVCTTQETRHEPNTLSWTLAKHKTFTDLCIIIQLIQRHMVSWKERLTSWHLNILKCDFKEVYEMKCLSPLNDLNTGSIWLVSCPWMRWQFWYLPRGSRKPGFWTCCWQGRRWMHQAAAILSMRNRHVKKNLGLMKCKGSFFFLLHTTTAERILKDF